MKDPLMGDAPSPEEWYYPALTFENEDSRRRFENVLIEKREAMAGIPDNTSEFIQNVKQSQRAIFDDLLDRLGKKHGEETEIVFETPGQLNVAMMAVNWVASVLVEQNDPAEIEPALDNLAELEAVLVEAHWEDDDYLYKHLDDLTDSYSTSA